MVIIFLDYSQKYTIIVSKGKMLTPLLITLRKMKQIKKNGYRHFIKSGKRQHFNLVSFAFEGYYALLCPRVWTGLFLLLTCTCCVVPVSPSVCYGAGDSELSVISLPSKVCTPLN